MKLLLDSHVLLWTVFEPSKLNPVLREAIEDKQNIVSVSIVSLWEIAIKQSIGRLSIPDTFYQKVIKESGFELLLIQPSHIQQYLQLPLHHRDPFDRMLIAQTQAEQLMLVTSDQALAQYQVAILL